MPERNLGTARLIIDNQLRESAPEVIRNSNGDLIPTSGNLDAAFSRAMYPKEAVHPATPSSVQKKLV